MTGERTTAPFEAPAGLWAWLCDKCGQELMGSHDTCNSGYHVGPDGKNVGTAISSAEFFERLAVLRAALTAAERRIHDLDEAETRESNAARKAEAALAAAETERDGLIENLGDTARKLGWLDPTEAQALRRERDDAHAALQAYAFKDRDGHDVREFRYSHRDVELICMALGASGASIRAALARVSEPEQEPRAPK